MAVALIVFGVKQYRLLGSRPGSSDTPPFGTQRASVDMFVDVKSLAGVDEVEFDDCSMGRSCECYVCSRQKR